MRNKTELDLEIDRVERIDSSRTHRLHSTDRLDFSWPSVTFPGEGHSWSLNILLPYISQTAQVDAWSK